jgi:hypothetical protein
VSRQRYGEPVAAGPQHTAYAQSLRPAVTILRRLAEDVTAPPAQRVYARTHARREMLRALRVLEERLGAAMGETPK